jgi:hypothetical protein
MSQPVFLMKAVERYASTCLGRVLMHRLREVLVEQPFSKSYLVTDEDVVTELKICRHCSAVLQPGVNCTFKITKTRHSKFKNCVEYYCQVCQLRTRVKAAQRQEEVLEQVYKPLQKKPEMKALLQRTPSHFRRLGKQSESELFSSFFEQKGGVNVYSLFH